MKKLLKSSLLCLRGWISLKRHSEVIESPIRGAQKFSKSTKWINTLIAITRDEAGDGNNMRIIE